MSRIRISKASKHDRKGYTNDRVLYEVQRESRDNGSAAGNAEEQQTGDTWQVW